MDVALIQFWIQIALSLLPPAIDTVKENSKMYQKHTAKVRLQAEEFAKETLGLKDKIPEEHLQTPKDSILIPALQTSLPYLSEEEIKHLFAKLIASSYDSRKNEYLHNGFINVITQLSPNDARILSYLAHHSDFVGIIAVKGNSEFPLIDFDNLINLGIDQVAISLLNLNRLGLVSVGSYVLRKNQIFMKSIDEPNVQINQTVKSFIENQGYNLYPNETFITELGKAFIKVCIE